ncbi:redox-regulated ATPase YchF, partial [Candidatus Parcubacteria bacterium]|nr:redox-regulated ATPase YchF [Candidatus Parcubacteria bacterium]
LPNVGKSTLFKALTKKEIDISNYPFCTIDPNVGIVKVPDERLEKLAKFSESKKIIPTAIEFVDIAGLVKDAHKGEGLGNKFLANIREVEMIVHIVRGFEDGKITHVNNKINPQDDLETINLELILADIETVTKRLIKTEKEARSGDKEAILFKSVLEKYKSALENEQMANTVELDKNEKIASKGFQLLTSKPILYIVNVNENQEIDKNKILPEIENKIFLPVKFEMDLSELSKEEALEFRKETNLDKNISGLDELIIKCYDLLNLMTFLTTGKDETRAWTVKKNSTAPQAGSAIHGDFEEKFIKASVINWQELLDSGSWHNAIEKGTLKTEGKEYVVRDGDVVEFKI